jgi:threonine dehydrogenase-like Zn-dependent dehydrogenase
VNLQASQAANGNFTSATAATSFTVTPSTASNSLAFAAIPAQTYGNSFQVSATSRSSGPITYSVVSGPATIAGNTVTVTGTGTVTLRASQAATAVYAASTATTSFVANPAAPRLSFTPTSSVPSNAAPFAVSATSNSTGAISYTVASGPAGVSGNVVTVTGAGTVTLVATQAATTNYTGAQVTATISVASVSTTKPTLNVSVVRTKTAYVAVTSSNSPGAVALSIVSGPAHLSGNNVIVTGTGTVTLMATQAGSGNYSAATATISFN